MIHSCAGTSLMKGRAWETAGWFPGAVSPPVYQSTTWNLCTESGVQLGAVSKKICTDTADTCEVYIKRGSENGVSGINTCRQYCAAYDLTCKGQYDDNDGCTRTRKYPSCDDDGATTGRGGSSDHICECGPPNATTTTATTTTTTTVPPTYTRTINGSVNVPYGKAPAFFDWPERRTTGLYLVPGGVGSVTVPASVVGKGLSILVGAHTSDHVNKDMSKRLDRVFTTVTINDRVTRFANPLGGGVYVVVPFKASLGEIKVSFAGGVVESPSFFRTQGRNTTKQEWEAVSKASGAPWADFETDKYMMQVPRQWIYGHTWEELGALAVEWETAMDGVCEYGGYPLQRTHKVLYLQPDVFIKHGSHGIGYPQINVLYNPGRIAAETGWSKNWMMTDVMKYEIEWHEMGHAQLPTQYRGETEAMCNFVHAYVNNVKFGVDFDVAFQRSFGPSYRVPGYQPDDAAIHWMITDNFKNGKEMDHSNTEDDQMRYQQRGYAKYADLARVYGWRAWEDFHKTENRVAEGVEAAAGANLVGNPNRLWEGTDSRTLRLSIAAGEDLTPLIHFWGVHPGHPASLAAEMAAHNLTLPYTTVLPLLTRYLDLIPSNKAAFLAHYKRVYPKQPKGGNPRYGAGWYNVHKDKWNEGSAASAKQALVKLIASYFPATTTSTVTTTTVTATPHASPNGGADNHGENDEHNQDDQPRRHSFVVVVVAAA